MTNRILMLKKIVFAAGIALLMAGNARAELVVFMEDFDDVTQTTSNGPLALGGTTPDVVAGDWFGSGQTPGVGNDVQDLQMKRRNKSQKIRLVSIGNLVCRETIRFLCQNWNNKLWCRSISLL